jgi:chromosome partition protein MukB
MSRTCATALALVNWKGVFYERYLLDRHVTALEGANGAGKTTVMIAAYVVLLPDLARLRFTNLGETAATGGDRGLYGRLGEPGRPSYAAMELELGSGERIVAGVQLVRKSEPTLELTPFLVSGVDLQGSLKEILLVSSAEHDAVPDLDDVRAAVGRLGGKIQVFGSAKDYFGALFERGVNPLRLATEEERTKLHDMLRTSMTGGISRALTSELRSFLLKEESGLADTLVRMRANLEACRRTRTEVAEARALEHEITAIHAAGAAMFAAATAATHAAATDARSRKEEADERLRGAEARAATLARELEAAAAEQAQLIGRLSELGTALEARAAQRARTASARSIAERLEAAERERASAAEKAAQADTLRAEATRRRDARIVDRDRSREAYERAARGLGDLQAGLEELHVRAHAQRTARARLAEAQRLLSDPALSAESVETVLARVRTELSDVDSRRARAERERALAAVHAREHEAALHALTELRGAPIDDGAVVHDVARQELARMTGLEQATSRRDALQKELEAARASAVATRNVRSRAGALGVVLDGNSTGTIEQALASAHADVRAAEDEARQAHADAAEAARRAREAQAEAEGHESMIARWESLAPVIARLEVETLEQAATKRAALADERERKRAAVAASDAKRAELAREADTLDQSAGFASELLAVRDVLGADLLASRFEASAADESPALEAALGPLAHALVVADPGAAADMIAQCTDPPATVWLVAEEDVPQIVEAARAQIGSPETIDVVVRESLAVRVTRRPSRPVLGREARARRAAELRAGAEQAGQELAAMLEDVRRVDALLRDADRLLGDAVVLSTGDPRPKASAARQREKDARVAEGDATTRASKAEERVASTRARLSGIFELAADAHRLSSPDPEERVAELERARLEADSAAQELARKANARAVLADKLDALRHAPPSESSDGTESRDALEAERDRLYAAERALTDVLAHKEALAWEDLDARMADRSAVRASLEAQHDSARHATVAADEALRSAETEWERANVAWQAAVGEEASCETARMRLSAELAEAGGRDAAEISLETLDGEIAELTSERLRLGARERELATTIAVAQEQQRSSERSLAKEQAELAKVEATSGPLQNGWQAFADLASAAGVLPNAPVAAAMSPAELLAEARAQRALLATRLEHARGGADGLAAVRTAFARHSDEGGEPPIAYLEAWLAARAWVMRRLPAQFADVADPKDALERLRTDLSSLADRVVRQETELRGTSEDIARGIDVQLRKTATRVRRLNRDLANVAFGSVAAIRVQVKRVERMDLVLRALRGGEVQELLFQSDVPFEDALAEVFRRYGGGGRAGAQRILDYREYLDLVVEIRRKASTENTWEVASPTRLSTGEAIGVGAALMMVVLTEWERDANLLRSDRPTGTLRFLFLDEANRLSPDNLAVLFDLCRALDLQLLVAAPEVARAHGNTTYRLVRHVDASGREEVLVSGRRAVPPSAEATSPTDEPAAG